MNGVKEGPIAGASTTTEGAGAGNGADDPLVKYDGKDIDLGGRQELGAQEGKLPLPPIVPDTPNSLPLLQQYSDRLGIPFDQMTELWQSYQGYAEQVMAREKYGQSGGRRLNFLEWMQSNPLIMSQYGNKTNPNAW